MKYDVYDPAIHGRDEWAEVDATTADAAAVQFMTANADPLDFDAERTYPILVRRDGGDWEAVSIGIGREGDDHESVYYWEHRGRWAGRRVTPPEAT